jgi:hypothetical protein
MSAWLPMAKYSLRDVADVAETLATGSARALVFCGPSVYHRRDWAWASCTCRGGKGTEVSLWECEPRGIGKKRLPTGESGASLSITLYVSFKKGFNTLCEYNYQELPFLGWYYWGLWNLSPTTANWTRGISWPWDPLVKRLCNGGGCVWKIMWPVRSPNQQGSQVLWNSLCRDG